LTLPEPLRRFAPSIVTGILLAFAFPRFGLFPLAWAGLVPLLWRTRDTGVRETALQFLAAGFVFHVLVLQWLLANIMWAGGWAVVGQQLLCVFLAAYWGALGAAWAMVRRTPYLGGPWVLAVLWMAMEQLQATLFTGFGWSALGYSQGGNLWALQWASVGTNLLLAGAIVLSNGLIVESMTRSHGRSAYAGALTVLLLVVHGGGYAMLREPSRELPPLRIGVFQSNFSLEMKWDPEYRVETVRNSAEKSLALARTRPLDLMVWPEALILEDLRNPAIDRTLRDMLEKGGFALLTGAARWDDGAAYNTAFLIEPDGTLVGTYDKIRLAPFGEYVPLSEWVPFIAQLVPTIGDLRPGEDVVLMESNGRTLGPLICFEVLFQPMAQTLRDRGADALVVVTNLAWFGRSTAIPQELEIARMRAVETRMPLVHAANTGVSGVFDPYGRFEPVDVLAHRGPDLLRTRTDPAPDALVMQRMLGAFDLVSPAPQPFAPVHRYGPWATVGLAALLLASGLGFRLARGTR